MFNRSILLENANFSNNEINNLTNLLIKKVDKCLKENKKSINLLNNGLVNIIEKNYGDKVLDLLNKHYNLKDSFRIENDCLVFYTIRYNLTFEEFNSPFGKIVYKLLEESLKCSKKGLFKSTLNFKLDSILSDFSNNEELEEMYNDLTNKVKSHLFNNYNLDSYFKLDKENLIIDVIFN